MLRLWRYEWGHLFRGLSGSLVQRFNNSFIRVLALSVDLRFSNLLFEGPKKPTRLAVSSSERIPLPKERYDSHEPGIVS